MPGTAAPSAMAGTACQRGFAGWGGALVMLLRAGALPPEGWPRGVCGLEQDASSSVMTTAILL